MAIDKPKGQNFLQPSSFYQVKIHLAHSWKTWNSVTDCFQCHTSNNGHCTSVEKISNIFSYHSRTNKPTSFFFNYPLRPTCFITICTKHCSQSLNWCCNG